jgi:predicted helicase
MYSFDNYINNIQTNWQAGNSTEHTHRSALQNLVQSFTQGITATNEPKRIACGAPDYIVTRSQIPLGYIEAKDIGKCLNQVERSDQIKRYFSSLNNLIVTDYLEFRWYVGGEKRLAAKLANGITGKRKLQLEPKGAEELTQLLNGFLTVEAPTINTPQELAQRMAKQAQLIRDLIYEALKQDRENSSLQSQLKSFREVLLRDLTNEQFADMYAQTITYGMFTARYNTNNIQGFSRQSAAYELPKTNPFLRKTFGHIAGFDLDERIAWIVDDLAEMLRRSDMASILQDFGKKTRTEDPVVYFYENFLAEYDPKLRKSRGVYYTPEPVVSYLVRSVDHILKQDFGIAKGLADDSKVEVPNPNGKATIESHKVLILDPAIGTGTFLAKIIDQIYATFGKDKGIWSGYVKKHLLPRLFGFELMMAPYTVAHLKLGLKLKELGYQFDSEERLGVFLTNTLEKGFQITLPDGFTKWIQDESDAAKEIKQDSPVMVIMGNPPYSGNSQNNSDWIYQLLRGKDTITEQITSNYFKVDGKPLGEKNPKYLNDDYVKFIRFAQWRIEQTGYGILAFVTNHGYLDNPTFRGMRQSLLETYDDIYVLDLHGNSKKKERCPDGSKDENVFDIQQGAAISIFVKRPEVRTAAEANVHHAHLWGLREEFEGKDKNKNLVGGKYHWLEENEILTTKWTKLKPQSPFYLFVPQDNKLLGEYENGWKVTDIMAVNVLGFQTHRDHFAIDFDKKSLYKRIEALYADELSDEQLREKFNLDKWDIKKARTKLRNSEDWEAAFSKCLYRPFDRRECYFSDAVMDRPRRELINHVAGKNNLCLGLGRQGIAVNDPVWSLISVSTEPIDSNIFRRGGVNVFPLYLYPTNKKEATLFDLEETPNTLGDRRPNLSDEFISDFAIKLGINFIPDGKGDRVKSFAPEDIFAYMYAIFHSPAYRKRYAEFLKTDFPRLPLTSKPELFKQLCDLGDRLIELHLMEKPGEDITTYPIEGENIVDKVSYSEPINNELGKVWINKTQYFKGVSQQVWEFYIGGYQVCEKWLKDRKGRTLSYEDLMHYKNIVSAISETIDLMNKIDKTIEKHDGFPIM